MLYTIQRYTVPLCTDLWAALRSRGSRLARRTFLEIRSKVRSPFAVPLLLNTKAVAQPRSHAPSTSFFLRFLFTEHGGSPILRSPYPVFLSRVSRHGFFGGTAYATVYADRSTERLLYKHVYVAHKLLIILCETRRPTLAATPHHRASR